MKVSVSHWHSSGCEKNKPVASDEEFSFQGPWINRTYLIRIILPGHTHPTSCPSLPCWTWSTKFTAIFFPLLPLKIYTLFLLFCLHKIPSACTRCLMTFNKTEAIASPFQRLSTHLMLEPGITWATKATTSWPEPQLFLKFFWWKKREAGEDSANAG